MQQYETYHQSCLRLPRVVSHPRVIYSASHVLTFMNLTGISNQ